MSADLLPFPLFFSVLVPHLPILTMGIHGLARLIADVAPEAIKEVELKSYFGRRIAIDASMSLYQFLIAIRHQNNVMTNDSGETTSHIVGFFYRTCKMLEAGIKPVYVFDGKPPQLKSGELQKRKVAREAAEQKLEVAAAADVQKLEKRLVRVTRSHNDDVKQLLRLMGLPVIESPSEAEAQCAQLAKEGLVYAVATEDMDALTFGTPRLIRNLSSGAGDKVKEFDLNKSLCGMGLDQKQFVDLCILMGCDYCGSIKGIGPKKGLELIRKHSAIENILTEKYNITEFVEDVQVVYQSRNEDGSRKDDAKPVTESTDATAAAEVKEDNDDHKDDENLSSHGSNGQHEKQAERKTENGRAGKNGSAFQIVREKIKAAVDEEVDKWAAGEVQDKFPGLEMSDREDESDSVSSEDEDVPLKKKKVKGKKEKVQKDERANVPDNWLFKGARKLFHEPNVLAGQLTENDLKIRDVDEKGLIAFLVKEHAFSEERVLAALKRIKTFKQKSSQSRIDSFFKVLPKESSPQKKPAVMKRKNEPAAAKGAAGKRGRKPK